MNVLRFEISEEVVYSDKDVLHIIFPMKKSRIAAEYLVEHFRNNGGYITKEQMSEIANRLDKGLITEEEKLIKYSRRNFYLTVVKRLVELGFVQKNVRHRNPSTGKEEFAYMRNIFDIPSRPPSVGFWRLSYFICRKWNNLFSQS